MHGFREEDKHVISLESERRMTDSRRWEKPRWTKRLTESCLPKIYKAKSYTILITLISIKSVQTDKYKVTFTRKVHIMNQFVRLFACLVFFVPLKKFSLKRRCHHYRGRATNFDLISVLMVIEQWGFFNVPHLCSS